MYQVANFIKDALRTEAPMSVELLDRAKRMIRLIHAQMGMTTETGEFTDQLKRHIFYDAPLDTTNLEEEIADWLWYAALALDVIGQPTSTFESLMERVVAKLKKRFPEKFTEHHAVNRELAAERKELEAPTGNGDTEDDPRRYLGETILKAAIHSGGDLKHEGCFGQPAGGGSHPYPSSDQPLYEAEVAGMQAGIKAVLDTQGDIFRGQNGEVYLLLRLDLGYDDKRSHASRQAARQYKKLIWEDTELRQNANRIEQAIIAIEETLPPLRRSKVNE